MDEIELKLQLDTASADLIETSDLLSTASSSTVQQRSIYFDTPDRALAAADISFRIRHLEDRRVQTVKAAGRSSAGLFARSEWEKLVDSDVPVIDNTTPVQALLGADADDLALAFIVEMSRRTWTVTEGSAVIEVVLDRGAVVAGDRLSPVCEMELELKSGPPDALFMFARKVNGTVPTKLGVLTKADRGYLLTAALPKSVKAEVVPLTAAMTAQEAFQQITQSCIRQFRRNEDMMFPARAPEPLHQARVAIRRLRSAFTIFKPVLGADAVQDLRNGLRDLAGALGPARDLDVLLERAKAGPLKDRLRAEREAAYDHAQACLDADTARTLMLNLIEWIGSGPWLTDPDTVDMRDMPARDFAADALSRFRRKVKKGGHDMARLEDEVRHDVRKDAKKLRYAAEFFAPLFEGKRELSLQKKFIAALEEVQEQLGALNDLATAPHVLERLGVADDPEASSLLAGGRKKSLLSAAADAHDDFANAPRYWR